MVTGTTADDDGDGGDEIEVSNLENYDHDGVHWSDCHEEAVLLGTESDHFGCDELIFDGTAIKRTLTS